MYGLKFLAVHKTFTTEEADRDSVAPVAWELSLATRTVGRTDRWMDGSWEDRRTNVFQDIICLPKWIDSRFSVRNTRFVSDRWKT